MVFQDIRRCTVLVHYDARTRWNGAREYKPTMSVRNILVCVVLGVHLGRISAPSSHLMGVEENDENE